MAGISPENALELLRTGKYSDFLIRCGVREWSAHKAYVCVESSYFEKVSKGNFSDGDVNGCSLKLEDPDIIDHVLRFLYSGNYMEEMDLQPDDIKKSWDERTRQEREEAGEELSPPHLASKREWISPGGSQWISPSPTAVKIQREEDAIRAVARKLKFTISNAETHIKVYTCADRLDIQPLKSLAATKFLGIIPMLLRDKELADLLQFLQENAPDTEDLSVPVYALLFSKQLLLSQVNKPVDELLRERELVAYVIASKAHAHVKTTNHKFESSKSYHSNLDTQFSREWHETERQSKMQAM